MNAKPRPIAEIAAAATGRMIASGETRFGFSGVGSGAIVVSTTVVRRSVDFWLVDGCVSGSHVTVVRTGVGATSATVELRSPTHS